ncbi:MAG: malonate decarboxylase subunit epsilon [Lautropia sp.]|nr:malonate decarboxylase subunit epsilon [Lautropia sp.]
MSVLFSFPGQGSQSPGMLSKLPDTKSVQDALKQAEMVLGQSPLMLETSEALRSTVAVQLSLLVSGVAMARTLMVDGAVPDMVAGMSIGAFPAAVVAGVLDYASALRLVTLRAKLMEDAFSAGYGMTAVIGLDMSALSDCVYKVSAAGFPVFVANLNAEHQFIVAGSDEGMQAVCRLAFEHGALRCERLAVSVPSHCELLKPVASALMEEAKAVRFQRPKIAYLSCSLARAIHDPEIIRQDLLNNVASQVNWRDTIRLAWERSARLAVEMPSGSVLTSLSLEAFAEGRALACDGSRLDTIVSLVRREKGC